MRYPLGLRVIIPYADEGQKKQMTLNFSGDVDHRRAKREVRKYIKYAFGISVSKEWLTVVPLYQGKLPSDFLQDAQKEQIIEEWIKRIECHEDEDESDSPCEAGVTGEAEVQVQIVPDQSQTDSDEGYLS